MFYEGEPKTESHLESALEPSIIEALPFYWLSQTIHSALVNDPATVYNGALSPGQLGPDRIAHLDMKAMLQSARVFVSRIRSRR